MGRSPTAVDRVSAEPLQTPATAAPRKTGQGIAAKQEPPGPVARGHQRAAPRPSLAEAAQAAENKAIKAWALVEADNNGQGDTISRIGAGIVDAATRSRDKLRARELAEKNLIAQTLWYAKVKQDLAAAKPDYDAEESPSREAELAVRRAERLLRETGDTEIGIAEAAEDRLVMATARVKRAEVELSRESNAERHEKLRLALVELKSLGEENLKVWTTALEAAQTRMSEVGADQSHRYQSDIDLCKLGLTHAVATVEQIKLRVRDDDRL
jgi:hypothetical protein